MGYRTLGASGCAVSSFCLGTMTFGSETEEPGAHQQLDRFVEAGGTFVDTAHVYSDGVSEQIIGRWLAGLRLSAEEVSVPDIASDPGPPDYPCGEMGLEQRDRRLPAAAP